MTQRVLFAWELGANFGHILRDLPLAKALRDLGNEVSFAVRDPGVAEEFLQPEGFVHLPVPKPAARPRRLQSSPVSYAEILVESGYLDGSTLAGLVRQWLNLFTLVQPTAIVIDHAPTALLAARIRGIPAALLGTGFEIPPDATPCPSIVPWEQIPAQRLEMAERAVVQSINSTLRTHKCKPVASVSQLFTETFGFLTTFAELDHYGARRGREYIGPIHAEPRGPSIEWPPAPGRKVLAYLRPESAHLDALLPALEASEATSICVIPRLAPALAKRLEGTRARLLVHAVPIQHLIGSADLIVSYGGAGTIAASLLAGVPMLLVPRLVEQTMGCLAVERLEAGIVIKRQPTHDSLREGLHALLREERWRDAARRFSRQYAGFNAEAGILRAAAAICALATQRAQTAT